MSESYKLHEAFAVHTLPEDGKRKAREIAEQFDTLRQNIVECGVDGRYLSIVTTKLEEACFYAKKGLAAKVGALLALVLCLLPAIAFAQAPPTKTTGQAILEGVLAYVVVPLLPILGALLVALLGKAVAFLGAREKESVGYLLAAKLTGASASVVADLNATLRPQLEAALADGVLTDAEKHQLKEAALTALKTKLPPELLKATTSTFGALTDTYLSGLIERAVVDQKGRAALGALAPPRPPSA